MPAVVIVLAVVMGDEVIELLGELLATGPAHFWVFVVLFGAVLPLGVMMGRRQSRTIVDQAAHIKDLIETQEDLLQQLEQVRRPALEVPTDEPERR